MAQQGGSLVSPHRESQLSLHGAALGAPSAGDDHPFLWRMVPDAAHRPAPVHRFNGIDIELLSRLAKGTFSGTLVPHVPLSALPNVTWDRIDRH